MYSKNFEKGGFEKKTHCVIVFVSVDERGNPVPVKPWKPDTEKEIQLAAYAEKLKALRQQISDEMEPFF